MNKKTKASRSIIDALKTPYGYARLTHLYRWLVWWDGRWLVHEKQPHAKKSRLICSVEEEYLDVAVLDLMDKDD